MKTIYIDLDEEVTSVVDRIRKIMDREIVLVIPQRALVLQSIVNLKLLKNQAQLLGRHLIVVTADQLGKHLATRAGLEVREKLGNRAILTLEINDPNHEPSVGREEGSLSSPLKQRIESPMAMPAISVADIVRRAKSQKLYPTKPSKAKRRRYFFGGSPKSPKPEGRPRLSSAVSRSPRPHSKKLSARLSSLSAKVGLGFIGASCILIVLIIFLVLPKAKVTLVPKTELLNQSVDIVVRTDTAGGDSISQAILGQVYTLEKKETQIFPTAGMQQISTKAEGEVTLFNEKGVSQILVATTRLMSDQNILFRTKERVLIPPARVSSEGKLEPGTMTTRVVADQAGPQGNIGPAQFYIVAFDPAQRQKVYAKSTVPFTGGEAREAKVLTQEDLDAATKQMAESLIAMGREEIRAELHLNYPLPEGALKGEIIEATCNKQIGEVTDNFELNLKVGLKALIFSAEEARMLALNSVQEILQANQFIVDSESAEGISFEIENINLEERRALLKVRVEKEIAYRSDLEVMRDHLAGKKEAEARAYLQGLDEIQDFELTLWPFWVRRVPALDKKIEITIRTN